MEPERIELSARDSDGNYRINAQPVANLSLSHRARIRNGERGLPGIRVRFAGGASPALQVAFWRTSTKWGFKPRRIGNKSSYPTPTEPVTREAIDHPPVH